MPLSDKHVGKGNRKEFIKSILLSVSHILSVEPYLINDAGVTPSQRVSPKISSWWRVIERSFDDAWFF